jgi:hypothetical protein
MNRQDVYKLIDGERNYQTGRWNSQTTSSGGFHSVEEWYVYLQDYVTEGIHTLARLPRQEADPKAMSTIRKLAAMCVCAMEQHDTYSRDLEQLVTVRQRDYDKRDPKDQP